ncbi:MAG: cytochrome ubiquinol oxidase subunit I [Myxococcales bacterium]|nr:cytochrome ubiquinol oxidase subunit I [Myxococcales bacterium]MCB9544204.1 cytochrome ubiquinol oxidase subunit I [Myxococcales bacterium]
MTDLFAARTQMAMSLGFHILFAVAGMAMPLLMVIAEIAARRAPVYRQLAIKWAKGTAILFAVGAVSGTVLSFELGLLWPGFMQHAGPIIGMPFSLEGFAFFIEAIFLGLYLYGRDRLSPGLHLASGVIVALAGLASGVLVVAVNAWMNAPVGFEFVDGQFIGVDPLAPFRSPAFPTQATHMALAAYVSVAAAVLGIHALGVLRRPDSAFHRGAVRIAFGVLAVALPLQIVTGDLAAKHLAEHQPAKLAAAEALFVTQTRAPLAIGGWPDVEARELRYAIELPGLLSFLAFADLDAEVIGLDRVPRADWPPVVVTHVAFQIMVGCGMALLALVAAGLLLRWRRGPPGLFDRRFLRAALLAAPLGLIAVEAGWFVTEVGRQPWIIHGVMRTADAVTPMPGLAVPLVAFTALYIVLGVVVIVLLRALFRDVTPVSATPGFAPRTGEDR